MEKSTEFRIHVSLWTLMTRKLRCVYSGVVRDSPMFSRKLVVCGPYNDCDQVTFNKPYDLTLFSPPPPPPK